MAQIIPLLGGDSTIPLLGGVRGGFLGREISVNISQITDLTHPLYPLPRGDFLTRCLSKNFQNYTGRNLICQNISTLYSFLTSLMIRFRIHSTYISIKYFSL